MQIGGVGLNTANCNARNVGVLLLAGLARVSTVPAMLTALGSQPDQLPVVRPGAGAERGPRHPPVPPPRPQLSWLCARSRRHWCAVARERLLGADGVGSRGHVLMLPVDAGEHRSPWERRAR